MTKTIQQSIEFAGVSPEELYDIYTHSTRHAQAIGAPVTITPDVGAKFEAFTGVSGVNLALVQGRMIVQSWRAEPWAEDELDSILTLIFVKTADGARIDLVQANVPDHALTIIDKGWHERYWKPWRAHLRELAGPFTRAVDAGRS